MKFKEYIKKRWLYCVGFIFIYAIPIVMIVANIKVVNNMDLTPKNSVSLVWVIFGGIYLIFVAKHLKKKILDLKPSAFRSFIGGIASLIPVTILVALIQVVQDLINSIPTLDVAKFGWLIIGSICIGLLVQVLDAFINRKYLYDLEITKLAKQQVEIEKRKEELINEK